MNTLDTRRVLLSPQLTELEKIEAELDIGKRLMNDDNPFVRETGAAIYVEARHKLIEFATVDPEHVRYGEPKVHKTWKSAMEQRERNFNRRYYNNPAGKPEFKY